MPKVSQHCPRSVRDAHSSVRDVQGHLEMPKFTNRPLGFGQRCLEFSDHLQHKGESIFWMNHMKHFRVWLSSFKKHTISTTPILGKLPKVPFHNSSFKSRLKFKMFQSCTYTRHLRAPDSLWIPRECVFGGKSVRSDVRLFWMDTELCNLHVL